MGGWGSPLLQVFTYLIISFTLQAPLGPKSRLGLTVTTSAQARAGHCQQVGVTWSPSLERKGDEEQSKPDTGSTGVLHVNVPVRR